MQCYEILLVEELRKGAAASKPGKKGGKNFRYVKKHVSRTRYIAQIRAFIRTLRCKRWLNIDRLRGNIKGIPAVTAACRKGKGEVYAAKGKTDLGQRNVSCCDARDQQTDNF